MLGRKKQTIPVQEPLKKKKVNPWEPPNWDPADAYAIQACIEGKADPHQQTRAMQFIVDDLCATYDLSFRPDTKDAPGDRATDFAEGKRWVGLQLVKLCKLNLAELGKNHGGRRDSDPRNG